MTARKVNKMSLLNKVITIDNDNWYYEEETGIRIVHIVRNDKERQLQTDQFYIPWKRLLESVVRKYNLKP